MTIGQKVAKIFKAQYFSNESKRWDTFKGWQIQPEQIYTVLLELHTEEAVAALVDKSWIHDAKEREK
jgi:hypothetical protein